MLTPVIEYAFLKKMSGIKLIKFQKSYRYITTIDIISQECMA